MCVIIYKPTGVELSTKVVEGAYSANPQGWGLAWYKMPKKAKGQAKEPIGAWWFLHGMDKDSLLRAHQERIQTSAPAILHCRIASRGKVSEDNAHPFRLKENGGLLFHNGTLGVPSPHPDGTDSEGLALMLDRIANLWDNMADLQWREQFEGLLGMSRVVLVEASTPEPIILNETLGQWKEGLWASNDSPWPMSYKVWSSKSERKAYKSALKAITGGTSVVKPEVKPGGAEGSAPTEFLWEDYTVGRDFMLKPPAPIGSSFTEPAGTEDEEAYKQLSELNGGLFTLEGAIRENPERAAKALQFAFNILGDV